VRNINHILQSIKDYKGIKTNTELAEFLGIGKSAISNWLKRNTLDEHLIQSKIPEIRLEFLRTGEHPMTEQLDLVQVLMERIARLERQVEQLEKEFNQ
jgi:predicted transcriptional regulator